MARTLLLVFFGLVAVISTVVYLHGDVSIVHSEPVIHNLTRAAWAFPCDNNKIAYGYTTLEGYNRKDSVNRYLITFRGCEGEVFNKVIPGSSEGRSVVPVSRNELLIGSSLDPALTLYDSKSNMAKTLSVGPAQGMWIHQLATTENDAFYMYSSPFYIKNVSDHITRINLKNGKSTRIPLTCVQNEQGYAGVQTVDPNDRIWFYRAFPVEYYWYDRQHGCQKRLIDKYQSNKIISWEYLNEHLHYIVVGEAGEIKKVPFDKNMADIANSGLLRWSLVPLDLFHNKAPQIQKNIFIGNTGKIYRCSGNNCVLLVNPLPIDGILLPDTSDRMITRGITFISAEFGEMEAVFASDARVIFWVIDTKKFIDVNLVAASWRLISDPSFNLTAANITALVNFDDNTLLGAGYLTTASMFSFDKTRGISVQHDGAVPFSQGQVNHMFRGIDGNVYGAAYPDSVFFKYDHHKPWVPGRLSSSNPINLGALGSYNQQRATQGFLDNTGIVWYLSSSDFSDQSVQALSRIDFGSGYIKSINSRDHKIPKIQTIADLNDDLLIIGESGGKKSLYRMNKLSFVFHKMRSFDYEYTTAVTFSKKLEPVTLLTGDNRVYLLDKYGNEQLIYKSIFPILKLFVSGDYAFLVGRRYITRLSLDAPYSTKTKYSFLANWKPYFFYRDNWLPATYDSHNSIFYFADDFKLYALRFN